MLAFFTIKGGCANAENYIYYTNYDQQCPSSLYSDSYPQVRRKSRRFARNNFARPARCCRQAKGIRSAEEVHERIMRKTQLRRENAKAYIYVTAKSPRVKMNSRFDKNYKVKQHVTKVSCGGVTYYGIMNPCE